MNIQLIDKEYHKDLSERFNLLQKTLEWWLIFFKTVNFWAEVN